MKRMTAVLIALTLVFTIVMVSTLAEEPAAPTFRNGIQFNMDMDQVITLENRPRYEIESEKNRGTTEFYELEYENVPGDEGMTADLKFLFVGNSLVAIHYDFKDNVRYEDVKAMIVRAYGETVPFDAAKIGNGRYAVDDDGDLRDCREMIEGNGVTLILEQEKDGDVDLTILDPTAAYINN